MQIIPNIQTEPRLELGDLILFLCKAKNLEYRAVANLIPAQYLEGSYVLDDNKEDWCKELIAYMKSTNIDAIEIFQDS